MGADSANPIVSVEFEVYGNVQGLYFTKYCKDLGDQLQIGGWVKNTKRGTIFGKLQGTKDRIDIMVDWLTNTGSPGSKIERCQLTNWETLARLEMKSFSIRF
ncbi:acylphosphatase-2 [Arctopsyche grandis]|uniref:acylphosphatase-2 n=1 Tax=Arctopsyche grandis TaxID=121162 RepID=UPI00406D9F97